MSNWNTFKNGLLKENPVLVMLLGLCPSLATTMSASTSIGMGLATTFVLLCSNVVISLIKGIIPKEVRLPCYIVVIAGFVTFVSFMLQSYMPSLYDQLGIFLSLIVVNCIILGRAEMFASKNGVVASAFDGLGMGIGFTLALFAIGSVREIFGLGSIFGTDLPFIPEPMTFFITPAGGFFVLGILIAVVNIIMRKMEQKPKSEIGCDGCPQKDACKSTEGGGAK